MSATRRLHLVRHAESRWNVELRYQGHGDSGLTDAGLEQAEQLADWLVDHVGAPDRIVASDLPRAHATAAPYAARVGAAVSLDPRFREVDIGAWSGRLFAEIAGDEPELIAALAAGDDLPRGGGETFAGARVRVGRALDDLAGDDADTATIVFTHGGPIRVAVAEALGLPAPGHGGLHPPTNCSISSLEHVNGDWRLVEYNRPTVVVPSTEPTE
jgi:glucosyl-3-phosphoglycerate phosphatase